MSLTMLERIEEALKRLEHVIDRLQRLTLTVNIETPVDVPLSAAELRFRLHLEEHGCARNSLGFAYCDEAMRLFAELPPERQVLRG